MKININRKNPIPLYYQLKEEIKKEIINRHLPPGTKIITERKLMSKYNLSYPTVTRALRDLVHEGFLERVQGKGTYVADRKKNSLKIGLVIPHLHPYGDVKYFVPIVNSIEGEAKRNEINTILCLDNDDIETEAKNIKSLLDRKVDGIIIYYIGQETNIKFLRQIQKTDIPLVLIDRYIESIETDYVVTDNLAGGYEATKFLLHKGLNLIFHFTNPERCNSVIERMEGFKKALMEYKIRFDNKLIKRSNSLLNQEEEAYDLAKDLLKNIDSPFGVFAVNLPTLAGVWRAIEEESIPYDNIALACFDEPPINILEAVPFIQVIQPLEEIGRRSVGIILDKLSGKRGMQKIVLQPTIQMLNSVRMYSNGANKWKPAKRVTEAGEGEDVGGKKSVMKNR